MNARERFLAIMNFQRPDRNLFWEMGYWSDTLERWYAEGLSPRSLERRRPGEGVRGENSPHDEFSTSRVRDKDVHNTHGLDKGLICLPVNSGPAPLFEQKVFEETEHYIVTQDEYGVRKKLNREEAATPEFIGWPAETREDFEQLKAERFQPRLDERVPENWPDFCDYRKRLHELILTEARR